MDRRASWRNPDRGLVLSRHALLSSSSDAAELKFERDSEVWNERAGIVEFDGRAPKEWAEGFATLDCMAPPSDVPAARWRRFIDDAGRFLNQWALTAHALGWTAENLFGCNATRPFARIDQAGLLWLLNGSVLLRLTDASARIETRNGSFQTYRRRPTQTGAVLAWELAT